MLLQDKIKNLMLHNSKNKLIHKRVSEFDHMC